MIDDFLFGQKVLIKWNFCYGLLFADAGESVASAPTYHKKNIDHGKDNSFHNYFRISTFRTESCYIFIKKCWWKW